MKTSSFVILLTMYDNVMEDELDMTCSTHGRDDKCIQNFSREMWREECIFYDPEQLEGQYAVKMDVKNRGIMMAWTGLEV
jgi:hypothetical protein